MDKIIRYEIDGYVFVDSYERCENLNVNKNINTLTFCMTTYNEDLKKKIYFLINAFKRSLEKLYSIQENNHYIYILSDAKGIILDVSYPKNLIEYCDKINLKPGYSLQEKDCGTNAISLASTLKNGVYISGKQHFCNLFHNLNCIALPIYDENNFDIIGICDISAITKEEYMYVPSFIYLFVKNIRDEYLKSLYGNYLSTLNNVEINILSLIIKGKSEHEIADSLKISVPYVKKLKNNIKDKLKRENIEECVFFAGKLNSFGHFHF